MRPARGLLLLGFLLTLIPGCESMAPQEAAPGGADALVGKEKDQVADPSMT